MKRSVVIIFIFSLLGSFHAPGVIASGKLYANSHKDILIEKNHQSTGDWNTNKSYTLQNRQFSDNVRVRGMEKRNKGFRDSLPFCFFSLPSAFNDLTTVRRVSKYSELYFSALQLSESGRGPPALISL